VEKWTSKIIPAGELDRLDELEMFPIQKDYASNPYYEDRLNPEQDPVREPMII